MSNKFLLIYLLEPRKKKLEIKCSEIAPLSQKFPEYQNGSWQAAQKEKLNSRAEEYRLQNGLVLAKMKFFLLLVLTDW